MIYERLEPLDGVLCSVLVVFPITHHPEYNLCEKYWPESIMGILFTLCFIDV